MSQLEVVRVVKENLELANKCLDMLSDMDNWTTVRQSEDVAVFTKGSDDEFVVRGEMLLKTSVFPVLALFSECQHLGEWVPILDDARVLGVPSQFSRVLQYFFKLPWPIENRDAVVSASAIPIPENKSVLIVIKSIDRKEYMEVNIPDTNSVRMNIKETCLNVMYISDNETQLSFIAKCDVKLALIPASVVNYATKHGVFYFMETMMKLCDEYVGSKYEELVDSKPDYYRRLRDRFVEVLTG